MSEPLEASRPLRLGELMKVLRERREAADNKRCEIPVDAGEAEQRSWHYFNGMATAMGELESYLRMYLDTFPVPPQFETPNPGEVTVRLSNGETVSIREDNDCLHIGQVDPSGEDWWICTISSNGTLAAPNCGQACEILSKGLKSQDP